MFNADKKLSEFYKECVQLGSSRRQKLAAYRDACLQRLKDGLHRLGEERGRRYQPFSKYVVQGSYAMSTLNQHSDDDYDIDVAVVFPEDALPTTALEARRRVADALQLAGGNFRHDPEARTNAVTVWYADGPHVDLAIYREKTSAWSGSTFEHAGAEWAERDPEEITKWFTEVVAAKSPSGWTLANVDEKQLRRIVRFVKYFAKSRATWSLPGGMIISALVAETYQPDSERDDRSLIQSLEALQSRLQNSLDVENPVTGESLTDSPQREAEVARLLEKLEETLPVLEVLHERSCTPSDAYRAWGKFFYHPFWSDEAVVAREGLEDDPRGVAKLELSVGVARKERGRIEYFYEGRSSLPKEIHLRFRVENPPAESVEYKWTVRNSGDEARDADDLSNSSTTVDPVQWRVTRYKGVHRMICEAFANGRVVARGSRKIFIASR